MSEVQTTGRLKVCSTYAEPEIRSADDKTLAVLTRFRRVYDARRLVACWNACDGLYTESLERGGPLAEQLVDVLNQRDRLLEALQRVMDVDCPLTGNPSHAELVEFWEYEKTQGRGEADDRLFALAAIAMAEKS